MNCHVSRGPLCVYKKVEEMPLEFHRAYVAYMNATRGAIYYQNPACVKSMVDRVYWMARDAIEKGGVKSSESNIVLILIVVGSTFVIGFVLLTLYYKQYKREDDKALYTATD